MKWPIWSPLLAAVIFSLLIRTYEIDQTISAMCYDSIQKNWPFERAEPLRSFYYFGRIPPVTLGIVGGIIAVFGKRLMQNRDPQRLLQIRRAGFFLALMLAIGPGLLVEVGLKSLWGRPRPVQCKQFGGDRDFLPVGHWATGEYPYSSFPSGHAAVAFYLIAPAFVTTSRRKRFGYFMVGGMYGFAMGITRVMQGGHFPSDVLWAAILVYLVGAVLARIMGQPEERERACYEESKLKP